MAVRVVIGRDNLSYKRSVQDTAAHERRVKMIEIVFQLLCLLFGTGCFLGVLARSSYTRVQKKGKDMTDSELWDLRNSPRIQFQLAFFGLLLYGLVFLSLYYV